MEDLHIKNGIKTLWQNMSSKNELLSILNKAASILYGDDAKKIEMSHLTYHSYSTNNKKRYISFQIPKKKKGEYRIIDAPCKGLKLIQQCLNVLFHEIYAPNVAAVGFVQNKSIVDGAKIHLQQKFVYNIDLKDFFPSITSGRLFKRLQSKPFCLNEEIASIITDLCCNTNAEGKSVLPQGAPTSPTITNFICERLDQKLTNLAHAYGLKYTRYADDITFSGMANVFAESGKFCKSLRHIIEEEEKFKINTSKTRLLHRGNRQEVTGITVNERLNVSRRYIKQLRTMIHNWETKGYIEAQYIFQKKYNETNIKNSNGIHYIENIICGKLDYLKMIKGEKDRTYIKLKERFDKLLFGNTYSPLNNHIDKIFETLIASRFNEYKDKNASDENENKKEGKNYVNKSINTLVSELDSPMTLEEATETLVEGIDVISVRNGFTSTESRVIVEVSTIKKDTKSPSINLAVLTVPIGETSLIINDEIQEGKLFIDELKSLSDNPEDSNNPNIVKNIMGQNSRIRGVHALLNDVLNKLSQDPKNFFIKNGRVYFTENTQEFIEKALYKINNYLYLSNSATPMLGITNNNEIVFTILDDSTFEDVIVSTGIILGNTSVADAANSIKGAENIFHKNATRLTEYTTARIVRDLITKVEGNERVVRKNGKGYEAVKWQLRYDRLQKEADISNTSNKTAKEQIDAHNESREAYIRTAVKEGIIIINFNKDSLESNNYLKHKHLNRKNIAKILLNKMGKCFVTEEQVLNIVSQKKYVTEERAIELIRKYGGHNKKEIGKSNVVEYPDPKQTYQFLSFFSQNDGGLKNLTHDFNYGYIDYDVFIAQCKKEFEEIKKRFPNVQESVVRRIEEFAFKESPNWYIRLGNDKKYIRYGWSEPSFVEWYRTNKIHPAKDTHYNAEMIVPFKNSIQVRADNKNLIGLLSSLVTMAFGQNPCCNVEITQNVGEAQFYTDVDRLGQAIYQIFSTIKDYSEQNFCDKVIVDYYTENDFKILTITHIDSKPTKKSDDKDYLGGNGTTIKTALFGLCNYEVQAEFPDGAYRKIILSDNYEDFKKGRYLIDKDSIDGYKHIMKFY